MYSQSTVRKTVVEEIRKHSLSLNQFSKNSGINRGVLSATLSDKPTKSMSIHQLDQMATALNKQPGWLYETFISECFTLSNKASWRRIQSILIRCIEMNFHALVLNILELSSNNPTYSNYIFDLAESFTEKGLLIQVIPLYQFVIEHESNYQSEKLAVSHYRLFQNTDKTSIENQVRSALKFYSFCSNLPEHLILDAWLKLANIYYTIKDWDKMFYCADELMNLTHTIYNSACENEDRSLPTSNRPLVVYYGQSYLIKFSCMIFTKKYDEAEHYLSQFTDLGWFKQLNEEGKKEVENFKLYAKCNHFNLQLLRGEWSLLPQYLHVLKQYPDEILPSLIVIIQAANMHQYNIDHVLAEFRDKIYFQSIEDFVQRFKKPLNYYLDETINFSRYIDIYYELAIYFLNRASYDKLKLVLNALELLIKKYSAEKMVDSVRLFHKLKELKNLINTTVPKELYE